VLDVGEMVLYNKKQVEMGLRGSGYEKISANMTQAFSL
jgi:hypothetical protein